MNTKKNRLKAAGAFGGALVLLAAFVPIALTQNNPSTLTPGAYSAAPGATIRVDLSPALGRYQTEGIRMVLRPSQAQGAGSDVVLRTLEYHGSWFLVQIPRDASPEMGPARLLLVNPSGDVLASSGNRFFRVVSATPPVPQKPLPGADARANREEVRPKERMTTPGVRAEAREAQVMTTPGVSAKAKRLPTPVVDFIGIGQGEFIARSDRKHLDVFNLPADTSLDMPAVLMFLTNPDDQERTLYIYLNGHLLKEIGFHEGTARTWHIRFDASAFLLKGRNELEISSRVVFSGSFRIDDIVLWFHRNIEW